MSIVFYWHPMSSASAIGYALAELNVPHERVKVDIRTGEQHHPHYLALNPNGKVPTLTVDGAPMFEALAIHLWLGHRFGVERGLWPAGGTPEALQALSWCAWSYVTYGAVMTRLHVATQGEEALRSPAQPGTCQGRHPGAGRFAGRARRTSGHSALDAGGGLLAGGPGGRVGNRLQRVPGSARACTPARAEVAGAGAGASGDADRVLKPLLS